MLDLMYTEDSTAEVDMNVVMTRPLDGSAARFTEVQGTAEGQPFSRSELNSMLELAEAGISMIHDLQAELVAVPPSPKKLGR